jgi:NAD(P)-dependent dehydrogenase (short-subunit alcohol dehydrogenase family)
MQQRVLEGRVVIVTGAAAGIGVGYARGIAAAGARVVAADIDAAGAERTAAAIRADGGDAAAVAVDIASTESTLAMAEAAKRRYGGIDGLVNNAALFGGIRHQSLLTGDLDYHLKIHDINLHGVLRCVRACYPSMRERGGGSIVNQSSTAAWMPGGAYGLTKLGVNGLTRDLAVELGPMNIRINAIAPGPIDTAALREGVPAAAIDGIVARMCLPRRGEPADLVGTCLFLLSDASGWMTGQILTVDGGHTFRV